MGGARRGTNSNALLENACLAQGIYPWITSNESLPELQMKWDCRDEVSGPSAPLLTIKSLALSQAGDVRELTFPTWLESRGSSSHRRTGAGTAMESTGQYQDTGCSHRSGSAEGNPCPRSTYLSVSTTFQCRLLSSTGASSTSLAHFQQSVVFTDADSLPPRKTKSRSLPLTCLHKNAN